MAPAIVLPVLKVEPARRKINPIADYELSSELSSDSTDHFPSDNECPPVISVIVELPEQLAFKSYLTYKQERDCEYTAPPVHVQPTPPKPKKSKK